MKTRRILVLCAAAVTVTTGAALATPGLLAVADPPIRGTMADPFGDKLRIAAGLFRGGLFEPTDVAVQKITIQPGGHTGWHSHPGPVLVVVKSGALTFYTTDCEKTTYPAGQSFVDRGGGFVHIARNEGTAVLELWATYIVPGSPGTPFRIDAPAPLGCPVG